MDKVKGILIKSLSIIAIVVVIIYLILFITR